MTAWFVDALDATAGLAFASWRSADLVEPLLRLDAPAVFIGAPDFRAAPLASRATGLAATHGSFQTGLFFDGRELGFETLDDLTEFLRRSFLGGGGGAGGSGGPRLPPPDDRPLPRGAEGPEEESLRDTLSLIFSALREAPSAAQMQAAGEQPAQFWRLTTVLVGSVPDSASGTSITSLEHAAAAIVAELLNYCPGPEAPELLARWGVALQRLGRTLKRLGLAPSSWVPEVRNRVLPAVTDLRRRHPDLFWRNDLEGGREDYLLSILLSYDDNFVHRGWHWCDCGIPPEESDAFECLTSWPAPAEIVAALNRKSGKDDVMSVADLLCLATAAPMRIDGHPLAKAVLLFSAACLISGSGSVPSSFLPKVRDAWRKSVVCAAADWVAAQMPKRVFAEEIETMIAKVEECRYAR